MGAMGFTAEEGCAIGGAIAGPIGGVELHAMPAGAIGFGAIGFIAAALAAIPG